MSASIDPLAAMHGLRWLGLENIGKIDDLDPIRGLVALEGLSVDGSLWTTQRVRTLEPIGRLTGLLRRVRAGTERGRRRA